MQSSNGLYLPNSGLISYLGKNKPGLDSMNNAPKTTSESIFMTSSSFPVWMHEQIIINYKISLVFVSISSGCSLDN